MKIINEEIVLYPTKETDGLYPEKLRGNLFRVQGITQTQYAQTDGEGIWSLPDCLVLEIIAMKDWIRELESNAKKYKPDGTPIKEPPFSQLEPVRSDDRKVPVDDLVKLLDCTEVESIVRLKSEGII